ncbi:hypothetical protein [Lactiplantibacillus plantarum]|uniref:hypothetical protein n=1 Tax=Lactiplantibacillus plantarum TaxID=1590 RepID=UPI000D0C3257|nr:hypothetical protein [Lactiplantibacillus plantarum]SPD92240.1 hypothetical protein LAP8962_01342 [Lactiplantibacillus plantarum]VFI62745.1 Chromosome partition protein Smc [Lactiplantibacillus plantarum]VFQ56487.1 Chromosome partition protein Smc [Lactiplantibacillus plantarum]
MAESNATQVILTDDGLKIIKAQNTADNAAGGVTNLNDPNLMSVIEKHRLEIQMDNFATIYAVDKDIATSEGIDFTAYDAAYHAYLTYMTPLVADMTTYSPIVRTTFDSMVTAVKAEQKRFNAATQAQYNQQINKAQTDISDGQTKYKALLSEADTMKSSVAGIAEEASKAISNAGFASNMASAASQGANEASQAASSAFANAMSAQNVASSAVEQALSAASDSKDAKQIAGAVSQSYKTLTDGSTMTIAELQSGLAAKLTKTDLNGYATQDWAQNQIKFTADGINGTISSIKGTVDSQTTSINDLQADSRGFKNQFTTVTDTLGKHDKDIGTLQADAKSLSSNFDSLNTANGTNEHNISELQQTAKDFSSTLETVQTQVQNSAVGTNLFVQSTATDGYVDGSTGDIKPPSYTNENVSDYISVEASSNYTFQMWGTTLSGGQSWYGIGLYDSDKKFISRIDYYGTTQTSDTAEHVSKTLTTTYTTAYVRVSFSKFNDYKVKLEKGSLATDWSANPADNATVTALTQVKRTADSAQLLATNNQGDIAKLQVTAHGLQSTISDKVSSDQLTQLSNQLTNKIKDLSSSTDSSFRQTANDINGMVKKGDVVNQFNLDAGGALLSTSGNSTKIVFSSPNILFDSANPVQIPNANIPGTLTGKTFEAGTITATTKITGADIEAPLVHSPSGSFKLDGKTGDIVGASIHSADNSWGIDKDGNINGSVINSSTINGTTFHGGDIINDANNTSKLYPTTISSDGHIYTTWFNPVDAMQTDLSTGALTTKYRAINTTSSNNQYEAYDTTLQADQIALFAGHTNGKDMSFTQSVTGGNQDGYVLISPLNGMTLHGDNQQITFNGTSDDVTPKGIFITPYGNINPNGTQNIWYVGNNMNMKTASFGIDGSGTYNIQFNLSLDIGNFNINTYHTITSSDNGPIHFNRANGSSVDIFAATVNYTSLVKSSLLSVKKDVQKADTAYWAQLVNSIDLATYQYKSDDSNSHIRLSSIVDDVNDTKQWRLPDIFISRDENGKLNGVDDSVLLNATLATVQEQQKEIDQLNGHNMELEARLNKLEARLNG